MPMRHLLRKTSPIGWRDPARKALAMACCSRALQKLAAQTHLSKRSALKQAGNIPVVVAVDVH